MQMVAALAEERRHIAEMPGDATGPDAQRDDRVFRLHDRTIIRRDAPARTIAPQGCRVPDRELPAEPLEQRGVAQRQRVRIVDRVGIGPM